MSGNVFKQRLCQVARRFEIKRVPNDTARFDVQRHADDFAVRYVTARSCRLSPLSAGNSSSVPAQKSYESSRISQLPPRTDS